MPYTGPDPTDMRLGINQVGRRLTAAWREVRTIEAEMRAAKDALRATRVWGFANNADPGRSITNLKAAARRALRIGEYRP